MQLGVVGSSERSLDQSTSGGEGGEQEQAQRETSQAPKRGGRGFTRTVVLQEQRSDVLQKPSRPTLPVRTYGTKEHLALEPGQTLAPRRPPPQPPIHRQVDSTRGYQGNGAFLPPTLCLVTCQRALPGSVARCQQCKKRLDRNRHPSRRIPYCTHVDEWATSSPQHTPSLTIWLSTLLVSEEKGEDKGGRKGNLLEIFV